MKGVSQVSVSRLPVPKTLVTNTDARVLPQKRLIPEMCVGVSVFNKLQGSEEQPAVGTADLVHIPSLSVQEDESETEPAEGQLWSDPWGLDSLSPPGDRPMLTEPWGVHRDAFEAALRREGHPGKRWPQRHSAGLVCVQPDSLPLWISCIRLMLDFVSRASAARKSVSNGGKKGKN